jgi:hypothetical protein
MVVALSFKRRSSRGLRGPTRLIGWFIGRVDLPFVHALQAEIDQRRADIVVEHRTVRIADRTFDDM